MATPTKELVFCFINDPQFSGKDDEDRSKLVVATLNNLPNLTWPEGGSQPLTCAGRPITAPSAVFINGDLTQNSGGLGFFNPGDQLKTFRSFYEKLKYPTYIGLGNHDLSEEPKDTKGVLTTKDDGRNQMWDYIRCYHRGYYDSVNENKRVAPIVTVGNIDAEVELRNGVYTPGSWSCGPDWKNRSFNYSVDVGDVHFVQLHRYGGDTQWGRNTDGLAWLAADLQKVGIKKRVVICQHFGFKAESGNDPDTQWTRAQIEKLLSVIDPYNVVGIFHGHYHNPRRHYQYPDEDYVDQITDIKVVRTTYLTANAPFLPSPWKRLPQFLGIYQGKKRPSFGTYICYKGADGVGAPITDIRVFESPLNEIDTPAGYTLVTDFEGKPVPTVELTSDEQPPGGVFLCYQTGGPGKPITDIAIKDGTENIPGGYSMLMGQNLTDGLEKYNFLCYSRERLDIDCFDPGSVTMGMTKDKEGCKFGVARISYPVPDDATMTLDVAYGKAEENGTVDWREKYSFTRLRASA